MTKVIIFDIGGVLLDSERFFIPIFQEFAKAIGADPEKMVALHDRYLDRMVLGQVTAAGFFAAVKKEFKVKSDLKKIWMKIAIKHIKVNKELLAIIDGLRSHYRTAILSNVTQTRSFVDEELGIYDHFDSVFLSYKLKMQKPSKRIFIYTLKKLKVSAGDVLFIDDKEMNLGVARSLGIKSIQFNNNAQLKTEFTRLGLL